jgi:uncharacterized protein (TIGR03083 family)
MAVSHPLPHRDIEDLLGAYVLDACEPDEAAAIDVHLLECDSCAAEVAAFRGVVELLGTVEAEPPPAHVETALLAAATRPPEPAADAYREAVERLGQLAAELTVEDWRQPASPEGWTCADLVAHLAAIDSLLVTALGRDAVTPDTQTEFLERTMASIERNRSAAAAEADAADAAAREWQAVSSALSRYDGPLDDQLNWFGLPLPARGVLITRAFETWMHTDDIRVATGRDRRAPSQPTLGLMSDVAVHLLPTSLDAMGFDAGHAVARVVLTGEGGGTWDLVLGDADFEPHSAPDVVVTADTVEFCRMAGGRNTPAGLGAQVEGDERLGRALVEAAAGLAMP